jgi:uncharacterized membrane protein
VGEWILVALLVLVAVALLVAMPVVVIMLWVRVTRIEQRLLHLRAQVADRAVPQAREAPPRPAEPAHREQPVATADIWLPAGGPKREPIPAAMTSGGTGAPGAAPRPSVPIAASTKNVAMGPPAADAPPAQSIEELVATRWMTWVGALAVVIGAGFAFKYLVDHELLGKTGRVAVGLFSGMACLAGGTYALTRQFRYLGQGLVGAALGILYLSLFAGCRWYRLEFLPVEAAFAGMVLVTAVGLGFSTWFRAQPIAVLGLLGGLLTPVMLSRGEDERWILFPYLLVLDMGVLGIAAIRNWNLLKSLAAVGTVAIWLGWFQQHYRPQILADTVLLMSAFFVVFALLGFIHQVVRRMPAMAADYFVILATPVIYFGALYAVTSREYAAWHGLMAIGMGSVYLLLAGIASARHPAGKQIILVLGGIAASFLTLAIPLQLTGHWIAIAWAAESVLLVELGLRFHERKLRWAGLALLAVVQCILVYYAAGTMVAPDSFATRFTRSRPDPAVEAMLPNVVAAAAATSGPRWTDIFNGRSFSFLASALAMAVLAWEYQRRSVIPGAALPGAPDRSGALGASSPEMAQEAATLTNGLVAAVPIVGLSMVLLEAYVFGHARDWITPSFFGTFMVATSLSALLVLWLAQRNALRVLRWVGLAVFAFAALLVAICLIATLAGWRADWHRIALEAAAAGHSHWRHWLVNPRGLGLLAVSASAAFAALLARLRFNENAVSAGPPTEASGAQISLLLGLLAHLTGLAMITTEVYAQGVMRDWQTATSLAITLGWTLYAVATLIAGIYFRTTAVRILALVLFLLTTLKVFLYDVWHLSPEIRTFAFIALGVALLLVSFLYRRFHDRIRAWIAPAVVAWLMLATGFWMRPAHAAAPRDELASRLEYRWPVDELSAPFAAAGGQPALVRIGISTEVIAVAREDLADLRILIEGSSGALLELPYVLVQPRDNEQIVERAAPMLNLSLRAGDTEFLLDASASVEPVNSLLIQIDDRDRNYERSVHVFGADRKDAEVWNQLSSDGYLLDVTRPGHRMSVSRVTFAQSRFAFYKVLIMNAGGPPLRVTGARLFDRVEYKAPRREFAMKLISAEEDRDQKETRVLFDLGHDRLPTVAARFNIRFDANYYRTATLAAADEISESAIWRTLALGQLYQIERQGLDARANFFTYSEARGRYLRLIIHNGDDRPLDVVGGTAYGIERYLITDLRLLPADKDMTAALYAGSASLGPPRYDLARTLAPYQLDELRLISLQPRQKNPHYSGPAAPRLPWTERNQGLIWGATIAGVAILGLLTALLLRGAGRGTEG